MKNHPLPRLDQNEELRELLLPYCRLKPGQIWFDKQAGHRVGCIDAADKEQITRLTEGERATLAIHDPPYNLVAFARTGTESFIDFCRCWIDNTKAVTAADSSLYVWLGADQKNGFAPLPEFAIMMRDSGYSSRSFITMRNQRGYGTQKNWMSVRQELLYYIKGNPVFNVAAEYTDIPKILRGYYKKVDGKVTENLDRSKSPNIRAGNVWVDVQQVFYRMVENVNGCYAQKPLKSSERIISAGSNPGDVVLDFFAHAGTTLIACEMAERICHTCDIDPIYCEITIRRLERFRKHDKAGWQNSNPFADEIANDSALQQFLAALQK
jgi:DNA modification methylase